jgi:hypothetical protein
MQVLRSLALASFVMGIALLLLGVVWNSGDSTSTAVDDDFTPFAPTPVTPAPSPSLSPTGTAAHTATPTPTPFDGAVTRFKIPRFNVDAGIEDLGLLPNNVLDVPRDPLNVGWYEIYDKPGFGGNALFSAHVDYYPNILGPFHKLARLDPDDEVIVVMENGAEYRYRVISKQRYLVAEIKMGELIAAKDRPPGKEWVTLITCGGEFVRGPQGWGDYLHRDVVIAERIS